MKQFLIKKNNFLETNALGFYSVVYTGYKKIGNPDFLNILKNTFGKESDANLRAAREQVTKCLIQDLRKIINIFGIEDYICIGIPRAKSLSSYHENQLGFLRAIDDALKVFPSLVNATESIIRIVDTQTTHLSKSNLANTGSAPYPGITKATCNIDSTLFNGKDVILIDDIYTKNVNIDEDCIQALLDNGAKRVFFYAVAHTGGVK